MVKILQNISSNWAYDIDKNPIDIGEIWDSNVLNQSIEMILGTFQGERLFNPSFGVGIQYRIFNISSPEEAETLLNNIANGIRIWEDRITIIESEMKIISDLDRHSIFLIIPYIIKRTNVKSIFKKQIVYNY